MRSTQRFQEEMWRNFDYPRLRKKKKVRNKMNERVKILANQCYETGPIGKDGWPEYSKFNEEKFTALIIRECIAWSIENKYVEANYDGPEFTKGLNDHFGIK